MNKKLYKLMNWADIEEIIYSECANPGNLLGPHTVGNSTLLQAFFPGAKDVTVKWLSSDPEKGDIVTKMEVADEDGYFAVLLPEKKVNTYTYSVTYETINADKTIDIKTVICSDPYKHNDLIAKDDVLSFVSGNNFAVQDVLGAHEMLHCGEKGVCFAVWSPNAVRVSVVGEFNNWDGRVHQMEKIDGGIFVIFIPGDLTGMKYQYEIKLKGDRIIKKNDVYSSALSDGVSVVSSSKDYKWTDKEYLAKRTDKAKNPVIFEFKSDYFNNAGKNFKKKLNSLIKTVIDGGFNHVQLTVQETNDLSCEGLFLINNSIVSKDNLKTIVDSFHNANIGVVFNWNPSGFSLSEYGMSNYDGTALYEHMDYKQGRSADGMRGLFQYGRNEVLSLLISNGLYWIKEFHADGLCISGVAEMLYLDYGKTEGNWIPNIYGGNENIEAIAFLKNFIATVNELAPTVNIIAEDSSTHSGMTVLQDKDGMGFDYKWNEGFISEFKDYMSYDPIERGMHHTILTNEPVYAFTEKYIIPMSTKNIGSTNLNDILPGDEDLKEAGMRAALAYSYVHPGFKLVSDSIHMQNAALISELNRIYNDEPAMNSNNTEPEGFEWLSNMNYNGSYISFAKKTDDPEDMLVVVANFAGIEQEIITGVPYEGKYHEILNTDDISFGGKGILNIDEIRATDITSDGRNQSIKVTLAPSSLSILKFEAYTEVELAKVIEERIRRNTPIKKTKKVK